MKLLIAAVVAAILVLPARADEKAAPKSSWSDFLKNLKNTLSQSAVGGERKAGHNSRAVAAVRGKKQSNMADPNEPAIKGDAKAAKAKREQAYDSELAPSIELLEKGKLDEGLKGLTAFKAAHPKYRVEDVDKAIEGAKAGIAEAAGTPAPPVADTAVKP
jgi:hypothetical protein